MIFACNSSGMITIPAGTLSGTQIVQAAGGANTSTTNSGQGTVTVTLPVSGNVVSAGGMVMVSVEICLYYSLHWLLSVYVMLMINSIALSSKFVVGRPNSFLVSIGDHRILTLCCILQH